MLQIQGSRKKLCNGVTRRDLLHIGGIGALGLQTGLADAAFLNSERSGKAKAGRQDRQGDHPGSRRRVQRGSDREPLPQGRH